MFTFLMHLVFFVQILNVKTKIMKNGYIQMRTILQIMAQKC